MPINALNLGRRLSAGTNPDQQQRLLSLLGGLDLSGVLGGGKPAVGRSDLRRLLSSGLLGKGDQRFVAQLWDQVFGGGTPGNPATEGFITLPDGTRIPAQMGGGITYGPPFGQGGEPGGGPGGAHDPSGFTFQGEGIPAPFTSPESGAISEVLQRILGGGGTDFSAFSPDVASQIQEALLTMLGGQGFPEGTLDAAQNRIRENLATNERSRILRRGEDFAANELFGSGEQVRAIEGIERDTQTDLANQLTALLLADAQQQAQSRQTGIGGLLGLGGLNLQGQGLGSNELMRALQIATGRELGLGQLDLGQLELELQRQIQQFLLNQDLFSNFFGAGEGGGPDVGGGPNFSSLNDLFNLLGLDREPLAF